MKKFSSILVILVALVALVVGIASSLPSFAHATSHKPVKLHCQAILIGVPQSEQPCLNPSHTGIVPLAFQGVWSQRVWVTPRWTFRYICDGSSPIDEYDILDEYNAAHGQAWEVYARHIPLQCNGAWHSVAFQFRYAHIIQIGVSRPVDALIAMEVH